MCGTSSYAAPAGTGAVGAGAASAGDVYVWTEGDKADKPAEAPVEPMTSTTSAAPAAAKRPVWSDDGDAPFEDAPAPAAHKADKSSKAKQGGGAGDETMEIVKTVVFALLIAMVLRIFLFQPFTIPSASMEPNLYEGDYIVVSKWSYGYSKHSIPFRPPRRRLCS